jgi:hypothetical protein
MTEQLRLRPQLEIYLELEEIPRLRLIADSAEDEARLISWLGRPATRRRIADAIADAIGEAA